MAKGLRYTDAVKLLGGSGPVVQALDNLAGAALSVATAGTSEALSLFDAKTEMVRLGHLVTGRVQDQVYGLGRHDRSARLRAAHTVLVVTAFFEAFDDLVQPSGVPVPALSRDEQASFATGGDPGRPWLDHVLTGAEIPAPGPETTRDAYYRRLAAWYATTARRLAGHLTGLAEWDLWSDRDRALIHGLAEGQLSEAAVHRYEIAQTTAGRGDPRVRDLAR